MNTPNIELKLTMSDSIFMIIGDDDNKNDNSNNKTNCFSKWILFKMLKSISFHREV